LPGEQTNVTAQPYAEAAELYASAGWAPLPLGDQPQLKTPPPTGYTGRDGTNPTADDISAWIAQRGNRNIGVRLPAGVVGIDVDDYGDKGGADTMKATAERHGRLPRTWVSTSRAGFSGIRWFTAPPGIMPGKLVHPDNEDVSGVEVIQHTHRYAVVPPSIHPEGRPYQWITPDGTYSDTIPTPADLPQLPPAWVDHIRRECSCYVVTTYDWTRYKATDDRKNPVDDTFDRWSARLNDSYGRHDAATGGVMALVAFRHKGWPGAQEALDKLETLFYAALGDSRSHREAEAEWKRMVDGAQTKAPSSTIPQWKAPTLASVSNLPAPDPEVAYTHHDPRVVEEVDKLRIREAARRLFQTETRPPTALPEILTLEQRLQRPVPPAQWRIEGWQPASSRVVLTAQYKAGKTTLTGNLARSLVDGTWWLDHAPTTPVDGKVTILDFEMSERQIDEWLGDQGIKNTASVVVVPLRGKASAFDILDPDIRRQWAATLRSVDTEYCIFDCLRPVLDALGLDEHRDAGQFLVAFDAMLDEANVPDALMVHHMGHSGERARGDSRIRDWPDVEWRLIRQDDEPSSPRFITAFGRDVDVYESGLKYDEATRHLRLVKGSRKDALARDAIPDILMWVADALEPLSGYQIEQIRKAKMSPHSEKSVRDALVLAHHDGLLVAAPGPRNATKYTIPGGA
jgi:hypothetical protein